MAKYKDKYTEEIIEAEQYTDPSSVRRIMNMIGTRGVINSTEGLYIFRDNLMFKIEKEKYIRRLGYPPANKDFEIYTRISFEANYIKLEDE